MDIPVVKKSVLKHSLLCLQLLQFKSKTWRTKQKCTLSSLLYYQIASLSSSLSCVHVVVTNATGFDGTDSQSDDLRTIQLVSSN